MKRKIIVIGIIFLLIVLGLSGCNEQKKEDENQVSEEKLPDLTIEVIEIFPRTPQSGKFFNATVYVKNIGNAPSEESSLTVKITNVSTGNIYPLVTHTVEILPPGQQTFWTTNKAMVNDSGSYQLWAEIISYTFDEKDENNNMKSWEFTAN